MDWVMIIIIALVIGLLALVSIMMFAGWVAKNFFGKSEAWLDYGIDDEDLL